METTPSNAESTSPAAPPTRRALLFALEVLLAIVIIALLLATWLPAIVGGNPAK